MANLSQEDRAVIADHPLNDRLDPLQDSLRKGEQSYDKDDDARDLQDAVSRLLSILAAHDVAFTLRSKTGAGVLAAEISILFARVLNGDFKYQQYHPLLLLVIEKAPDSDIWNAVFDLIGSIPKRTPPTSTSYVKSIPTLFDSTPRSRSSASLRGSQQWREVVRKALRQELSGKTFLDVEQFYTKYFEKREWLNTVDEIYKNAPNNDPLHNFPEGPQPEELEIWAWLNEFQTKYLFDAPGLYYRTESKKNIQGTLGGRQIDVILKDRTAPLEEAHYPKDIRVVGELTKTKKGACWTEKFTQLATYVREAWAAQPTRWFVHGFLMFGLEMQLWVFDRSGAYSSETFNVRENSRRFIGVMAGYALMTRAELGLDTFIQEDGVYPLVVLDDSIKDEKRVLQFKATPIFSQSAIACRGTSCFRTVDDTKVIKLSWRPDKKRSEVDYLAMARGVKGIPTLVGSCDVTTIEDLRKGLKFKVPKALGHPVHDRSIDSSQSSFTGQSTHAPAKLNMSGTKHKSSSTGDATRSKRHSSSQKSSLQQEVLTNDVDSKTLIQSLTGEESSSPRHLPYRNRVLTCLAISPAGRPLQEFQSVLEVLQAFKDAIKAHRQLFLRHRILHRDISPNNIILTDPKQNDGCSGMLIDLDLAVLVDEHGKTETSEGKAMTGILEFIALQILRGAARKGTAATDHTYRHDLESFFYVFLSLCVRYGRPDEKPEEDPLRNWYEGSFEDMAINKCGVLEPCSFKMFISEYFSDPFKAQEELARNLRTILFGKGKGGLYVETPENPATLYDPIIKAFEDAIRELQYGQRGLRSRFVPKEMSGNNSHGQISEIDSLGEMHDSTEQDNPKRKVKGDTSMNRSKRRRKV